MLRLGPKKSLLSLRLKLMAQGMAQCTDIQGRVWYHSAIQVPLKSCCWEETKSKFFLDNPV